MKRRRIVSLPNERGRLSLEFRALLGFWADVPALEADSGLLAIGLTRTVSSPPQAERRLQRLQAETRALVAPRHDVDIGLGAVLPHGLQHLL